MDGLTVRVWEPNEEYPDTVVVSWKVEQLGEVRVRMTREQARSLMEQIQDHFPEEKAGERTGSD